MINIEKRLAYCSEFITVTSLAEELGVSPSTIKRAQKGGTPSLSTIKKLSDHFKVDIDYLCDRGPAHLASIYLNISSLDISKGLKKSLYNKNIENIDELIHGWMKDGPDFFYSLQLGPRQISELIDNIYVSIGIDTSLTTANALIGKTLRYRPVRTLPLSRSCQEDLITHGIKTYEAMRKEAMSLNPSITAYHSREIRDFIDIISVSRKRKSYHKVNSARYTVKTNVEVKKKSKGK